METSPVLQAAVIRIYYKGKLLMLKRTYEDRHSYGWCLPGGKCDTIAIEKVEEMINLHKDNDFMRKQYEFKKEQLEDPLDTVIRELQEETSIVLDKDQISLLGTYDSTLKTSDCIVYVFKAELDSLPSVTISDEHDGSMWVKNEELLWHRLAGNTHRALRVEKVAEGKEIINDIKNVITKGINFIMKD